MKRDPMQAEAERLYFELGDLAQNPPNLLNPQDPGVQKWLGRVLAIVERTPGAQSDMPGFIVASDNLTSRFTAETNRVQIMNIVYRTLGRLERRTPAASGNAFISAGESFTALMSLRKVLAGASTTILFVDPYASATILTDYAVLSAEGVSIQVLTGQGKCKPDLLPAATAWKSQYGPSRPLEVRLASSRSLHDRAVFIDDKAAWVVGTSFNSLAKHSPTLLQKVDELEVFPDKLAAYRDLWNSASPLA